MDEHKLWNELEWERVIATMSPVFDGANVAFDFGNVLILHTKVETDFTKSLLERFKLRVGMNGPDVEPHAMVYLYDASETGSHHRGLTVQQVLNGTEV